MLSQRSVVMALGALLLVLAHGTAWSAGGEIKLPQPRLTGKLSVEAAMVRKKSVRSYTNAPLTEAQIGQLLWASNGNLPADAITSATGKVIPSAGGLYPLEVFLLCGNGTVGKIPAGVYRYNPFGHSLRLGVGQDKRTLLGAAALSQMWLSRAPAVIVIGAAFGRTTMKYGPRGRNYVYIEAGNANQNVYLQAAALGLRTATVGAFNDAQVSGALKLPADITPLLIMPVGK